MKQPAPAVGRRLTLTGSVLGAAIVALDGTVLTVAQPALRRDLGASLVRVQWTSTGYLIAVACLLVFAGRLGDRYGHRRLFALGSLGFGVTSAGIGFAPGIDWVIGLRVVQLPLALRLPGPGGSATRGQACPGAPGGTPYETMNTRRSTSRGAEESDGTPATRRRAA